MENPTTTGYQGCSEYTAIVMFCGQYFSKQDKNQLKVAKSHVSFSLYISIHLYQKFGASYEVASNAEVPLW